jgi:hypothetical protein
MNQAVPHTSKVMQDRLFVLECRTLEDACDIQLPAGSRAVDDLLRSVEEVPDVIVCEGESSQELVVEVFTLTPSYSRTLSPFPDMPMRSRMTEAP